MYCSTFNVASANYTPPQNVRGAILDSLCRVGRSVRPSPIRVRSITPLLMEGFLSNLNDLFTSTRGCEETMLPMCQLKVTVKGQIFNKQILHIIKLTKGKCVRSITPLLTEGFPSNLNDTFTSTRGCTEPMLSMCQLNVKVTVKGQILNQNIRHYVLSAL